MTYDLFDPTPPPEDKAKKIREATLKALQEYLEGPIPLHTDPRESEALAAERIGRAKLAIRAKVALLVARTGEDGMAPFECCAILSNRREYSVRPRFTELRQAGLISTTFMRDNPGGNPEEVFVATEDLRKVIL